MLPVMFSVCHHHAEITTNRHYGTSRPDMTEKLLTGTLSLQTKKKKKKKTKNKKKKKKKKEREREKKYENKKEKQVTVMILTNKLAVQGKQSIRSMLKFDTQFIILAGEYVSCYNVKN